MQRIFPILAGAAFTVGVSTAAGLILIRRLRLTFDRIEEVLFAFVSGSAVVSFLIFFLCLVHQARLPVFLAGGAAVVAGACFSKGRPVPQKGSFSRQKWLFLALILPLLAVYLANSLAPEVSPDGSGYHLGNVRRMFENHGFVWNYHSIYSYFPQGIEMLYLVAFAIGGMSAAATVHLAFLCALGLLIACYGRRFGFPRAGMFAGVLVFASPIAGIVGVSAYNDVALATCVFAVFYLLQVNAHQAAGNLLIVSGLLAGFCYSIKYPGAIVVPVAFLLLRGRGMVRLLGTASLMIVPWLVRNWYWVGNPVAPLFNRWFPNPFYSAEAEAAYLNDLRHMEGFAHWWEVPLDLTVYGARLPGLLGPVFLLSPFVLLALRSQHGRRLLTAAVVLALPAVFNPGARFLLPMLPFLALAMGIAFQNSPGVIPAVAAFHVLLGTPSILPSYCADWAWRLKEAPWKIAIGARPQEVYITRYLPNIWTKVPLESNTAKPEKIYSLMGLPEAYIERHVVTSYESEEGIRATRALSRPDAVTQLKAMGFRLAVLNNDIRLEGATLLEKRDETSIYRLD